MKTELNKAQLKKAEKLIASLNKERDTYSNNINKITSILGSDTTLLGGYNMKRKLEKQKKLFCGLVEVLKERIAILENLK